MAIERLSVGKAYWRESAHSHLQRYLFARDHVSGRILDVACGVGYGSYILCTGGNVVVGVDVSDEAIAEAKAQHSRPNGTFHLGPLAALPTDTSLFDSAVSLETIEHVPDPRAFLHEVSTRLKPGATFVISAPNVFQHTRGNPPVPNHYHLCEPSYEELHSWLAADFTVVEEWEQTRLLAPRHDEIEALARAGATLGQSKCIRVLIGIENGLRRILGKSLPPVAPIVRHTDALTAETALLPLLPARRNTAHTFVFVARKKT